jgi:nicotinamidase-related amidase/isocitrate/isopropylmalate dehydrogenase
VNVASGNGVVTVPGASSTGRLRAVRVGLAVGEGTGPELAEVFRSTTATLGAVHGLDVQLVTCPRRFLSYGALAAADVSPAETHRHADDDAAAYADWLRSAYAAGVRAVFRTAFNAQSLYLVREALWGVQVQSFAHLGGELLLVRDATQGFYTGRNADPVVGEDRIERVLEFRRDRTHRVLDFARAEAAARWGEQAPGDRIVIAYKFHLLDRRFARWVREYGRSRGVEVELYQPDTTNRHLGRGLLDGRVTLVGANEWADVMHTELLSRFGLGNQEEHSSRNIYLADDVAGLEEHQTVHGSADDIAGQGRVNPTATLRASAALLERHAGCSGARARMEWVLQGVRASGPLTPDLGGRATTDEVTAAALQAYRRGAGTAATLRSSGAHGREALVVVDVINDFCSPKGRFARDGLVDPEAAAAMVDHIQRILERARGAGTEVIFVRMEVDPATAAPAVIERNRREGRTGYLGPGGFGSDFFRVAPLAQERVITKAGYDPFLAPEFEAHLRGAGIESLTLVGAFADVCVDATARTAYQKGFAVRVLDDCTMGLERDTADALAFMRRFYGAEITRSEDLYQREAPSSRSSSAPPAGVRSAK